jgi:hypothetical protein
VRLGIPLAGFVEILKKIGDKSAQDRQKSVKRAGFRYAQGLSWWNGPITAEMRLSFWTGRLPTELARAGLAAQPPRIAQ